MLNHKFKLISLNFVSKLKIQIDFLDQFTLSTYSINLLDLSCQKCKLVYVFLIFHVKSQIQLSFLILCVKISNSNQSTGLFSSKQNIMC